MNRFSSLRRQLHLSILGLAAVGAISLAPVAHGDTWPNRPIQLVVPFPAGSSPDTLARAIAEPLAKELGQPIVVENKAGAGGNIGTRYASKAKPDGYTLLLTINGPMVTAPALYKKTLGYDPVTDLDPISLVGTSPNVLVVPQNSPAKSLKEFVQLAKDQPGALNYGSVGPGSSSHLAMAMLEDQAGITLQQIPYSGFPQIITSIIAGDIQAGFMVPGVAMPQVNAGKVRVLGITSMEDSDVLPGMPTMASQGYPGFESISWDAIFVPAGTPADIAQRLNTAITGILDLPDVKQKMASLYFTPAPSSPAELAAMVKAERVKLEAIINRLNLSLD
jgi:tripartite-type tricarboxylate transporter receptor subunit TctC